MADEDLRALERRAKSGDRDAGERLRRHRERTGTALKAVHYVPDDYHIHLKSDGSFDLDKSTRFRTAGVPYQIQAPCAVVIWPRGERTQRKICRFTHLDFEVTCKTCLRSMNKPKVRMDIRRHYAPGSKDGNAGRPVCQKSDPVKYREEFHHTMKDVNCPICCRIMQKGRRKARRPGHQVTTEMTL